MADTVVSPFLQMLSDRLRSLTSNRQKLGNLEKSLSELQMLTLDAEVQSANYGRLRNWITGVKNAAYDMDDLLDEFDRLTDYKPSDCFLLRKNSLLILLRLGRKIADIEARFEVLMRSSMRFLQDTHTSSDPSYEGSYSIPLVVGRDVDMKIILERLLVRPEQINVIPIVGMGGIGKTELARLVYNSESVSRNYGVKCWVSVGQDFDVKMIGKAIVESILGSKFSGSSAALDDKIMQCLKRKKFLIVLDDVWNEDYNKWNILSGWFRLCASESSVIVTTRSEKVALLMGTVEPYHLRLLSDDHCWLVFRNIVAFISLEKENDKMEQIGRRLVTECKGLPFAVVTLGGILTCFRRERDWLLLENHIWDFPEFKSSVLAVLQRSYTHLPSHLKQCFAYCSIFPKGYTISKEKLIQLWIAEGFVNSKDPEDTGDYYFMELLRRSFFMDMKRDDYGEIVGCQMHDSIHALARSVATVSCSIKESGDLQSFPDEVRYSSMVANSDPSLKTNLFRGREKIRTLLLFSSSLEKIPSCFWKLKSLRALDVGGSSIQELPKLVGNLIHLQYLDLSSTNIETLPDSIGNLRNLKTLKLAECYNLQDLPEAICELTNLRHLDIQSCYLLSYMPSGIGKLRHLQKLPVYILGKTDDCGSLRELSHLELSGKLEIKNLQYVRNPKDALDVELRDKKNLCSLKLSWDLDYYTSDRKCYEILNFLEPPLGLKVLEIEGYTGDGYPSWIMGSVLHSLTSLSLTNCSCKELPPLGQLPNLKDLYIKGMPEVEVIDNKFYGVDCSTIAFPSLKQLGLYDMPNMKEWSWTTTGESSASISTEAFPCLKYLTIKGCGQLEGLPILRNLSNLALWDCSAKLLGSLAYLTSLVSVVINEFREPMVLPEYLKISNNISKLTIYNCDDVKTLLDMGTPVFCSLKRLNVLYCHRLESLPTSLGYLTSLEELHVIGCHALASIPDTMSSLTKLEKVVISGSPKLSKRLGENYTEDWHKIARIPRIYIDANESPNKDTLGMEEFLAEPNTSRDAEEPVHKRHSWR